MRTKNIQLLHMYFSQVAKVDRAKYHLSRVDQPSNKTVFNYQEVLIIKYIHDCKTNHYHN